LILSFAERAGDFRGFTAGQVQTALVTMGLIALVPPIIATLLQKRLSAVVVAICGSFIHGAIGFGIMSALVYPQFFGSLIFFPFMMLFTHLALSPPFHSACRHKWVPKCPPRQSKIGKLTL